MNENQAMTVSEKSSAAPSEEGSTAAILSPREVTRLQADKIINEAVLATAGLGVILIPIVDFVGFVALQLRMMKKLSDLYGVEYSKDRGLKIVTSLIGGALPILGALPLASLVRGIPIVGWSLGAASVSMLGSATTYAIGQVVLKRYEEGGTLFDMDMAEAGNVFREHYEKGKEHLDDLVSRARTATGTETETAVES